MLGPRVQLVFGPERTEIVGPGALLGRSAACSVQLHDPSISEVHALVSLRGRHLMLLALRTPVRVGKRSLTDVVLQPGQTIALSQDVRFEVGEVSLPRHTLALSGLGPLPRELLDGTCSLLDGPELKPGYHEGARVWIWSTDTAWRWRSQSGAGALEPGLQWEVSGRKIRVQSIPLTEAASPRTERSSEDRPTLKITCRYTTVHLEPEGRAPVVLDGIPAQLFSVLAAFDAPTPWDWVAREVWGELDRHVLRQRWDRNLRRLRKELRLAGLDPQLVRADGSGNVELVVRAGDELIDAG